MGLPVREILKIAEKRLADAGCSNPKVDSELLFCYLMNIDRNRLFMHWADILPDDLCNRFFSYLDTRTSGVPLQYITNKQEFMGIEFFVNENVLIPRQETEIIIETIFEIVKERKGKSDIKKVLDLCTGSGAIAVSMAALCGGIEVAASDISAAALSVARKNAQNTKVKVDFFEGDLFTPFQKRFGRTAKFDMIISNPPYIRSSVIPTLQIEIKGHEPMLALDGGEDGLDFYRTIVKEAPAYLKKDGILVMEIGYDQADAITELASADGAYQRIGIVKDLAGHDRAAVLYT
ncbi:MAG: peptide chain release factor N(5)-glutamine methyltransferase [Eubacteriales bacterium]|nr:peptide chain release factor N(5)-glutamine methyltransferase [Eubacteriales bacterium]MDD4390493.1 peptide chain release factor N(5)-glutamine methyltransferase [Eubacteriales bacterium]